MVYLRDQMNWTPSLTNLPMYNDASDLPYLPPHWKYQKRIDARILSLSKYSDPLWIQINLNSESIEVIEHNIFESDFLHNTE